MEVKVLGSVSPYPSFNRNCPGYLVTIGNNKILLDCGNGCLSLLDASNDLENLTVVITHLHSDHYGDLNSLAYMSYVEHKLGNLRKKIKVYIPNSSCYNEVMEVDGDSKTYNLEYLYFSKIKHSYLDINYYDDFDCITLGGSSFISFKRTLHDVLCYAVRIDSNGEKLVYSADTGYQKGYFNEFIDNADLFICESSFLREHGENNTTNNHLYSYQAGLYAKEGNVKELMLSHFYPTVDRNLYLQEAKEVFSNTSLASENLVKKIGGKL